MTPKLLTPSLVVLDGDVLRCDWECSPRFYLVRIHQSDPRECPAHPHLYTPRVKVHVELEGDPTAHFDTFCDDDPDEISEAVRDCVTEIEMLCAPRWEQEACAELDDRRASEARFYYR